MRRTEPISYIHVVLGDNIRNLRKKEKLSQQELANMICANRSYLSEIERGIGNASVEVLIKLADGFNVSLSTLFEGVSDKPPRAYTEYEISNLPK